MEYNYPKPDKKYKVVIICTTYNQHLYIKDALEGFIMQETNFPFVAVVVDDCSTDGNQDIIREYEQKYPDKIKGIYLKENYFSQKKPKSPVYRDWMDAGIYIANCEGDDYWTDKKKLQRQVDFMDAHPDYVLCFHNAVKKWENHKHPDTLISYFETGDFNTEMIFRKWQLPFASLVYRKEVIESDEYKRLIKVFPGGFCKFIAASMIGKVYGISECMSVYRKNDGGVSRLMTPIWCVDINYRYALASGDKGAIQYEEDVIRRNIKSYIKGYLQGDAEAKEMKKLADKISPCLFYIEAIKYTLMAPIHFAIRKTSKRLLIVIVIILSFLGLLFLIEEVYNRYNIKMMLHEEVMTSYAKTTLKLFEDDLRDGAIRTLTQPIVRHSITGYNTLRDCLSDLMGH